MSIARALAVLGTGLQGYGAGQDQARKQQREEEDDAWRRKQRERTETQWQRDDEKYQREQDETKAVETAAKPVEGNPLLPTGDDEGNAMPMTPDMQRYTVPGTPGVMDRAGVDAMNTPASRMRRAAGAMKDPVRAAQTEATANQAETGAMQLDATKRANAERMFDDQLRKSAATWEGLTGFLSESKADGRDGSVKFIAKKGADGMVLLTPLDASGKELGPGQPFKDDEEGRATAAFMFARGTSPEAKLKHFAGERKASSDAADKKADNARLDATQQEVARHNKRMEELRGREIGIKGAAAAPTAPVWDDKADAFLRQRYTVTDPVSGTVGVDGGGLQFAKQIALAQAMRNGGDTTSALGYAFEIDQRIKQQAGDDPGKVAAMRRQLLQSLTGQPAAPAAAAPAASAPATPAAAPRMAAAATAPAAADPMAQRMAQESSELNQGKRTDFSPEVKQYIQQKQQAERAAAEAASAQAKDQERLRAIARSKEQLTGVR